MFFSDLRWKVMIVNIDLLIQIETVDNREIFVIRFCVAFHKK